MWSSICILIFLIIISIIFPKNKPYKNILLFSKKYTLKIIALHYFKNNNKAMD